MIIGPTSQWGTNPPCCYGQWQGAGVDSVRGLASEFPLDVARRGYLAAESFPRQVVRLQWILRGLSLIAASDQSL
jgi:hypothetical protein